MILHRPFPMNPPGSNFSRRWARITLLAVLSLAGLGCATSGPYPVSDHYDGKKFFNPVRIQDPNLFQLAAHIIAGRDGDWPEHAQNTPELRLDTRPAPDQAAITFVNHATVLIQIAGYTILTDPVWSTRVGPFRWAGPKRVRAPGIPFERLPRIDLVLISHNHYDHLDLPTLRRLERRDRPLVLAPLGDRKLLLNAGITRVRELDWWERETAAPGIDVTFTRAQHNSGRGLFDKKSSLWGGYFVRFHGRALYFAGDTAYADHFSETRARLGAPDIALLPIGAYAPRATMRAFHMDPADAVQAQIDLGAPLAIGLHYGTFQLTAEDMDAPVNDLRNALARRANPPRFLAPGEGRTQLFTLKRSNSVVLQLGSNQEQR